MITNLEGQHVHNWRVFGNIDIAQTRPASVSTVYDIEDIFWFPEDWIFDSSSDTFDYTTVQQNPNIGVCPL